VGNPPVAGNIRGSLFVATLSRSAWSWTTHGLTIK
jgi:hypothetical protein